MTTPLETMTDQQIESEMVEFVSNLPEPMQKTIHEIKDRVLHEVRSNKEFGEMAFALASIELAKEL